jgi:hypothetical protein
MKQLDRLLFEQGGDCFFCKQPLSKEDASVEHLLAQANGGTSTEENVVACCKAINSLLSNKLLKEKFAIVLRQKRGFHCPAKSSPATQNLPQPTKPAAAQAVAKTPTQPPAAAAKKVPAPAAVSSVGILALSSKSAAVKCPTCRSEVPAVVGQVDYVCPHCKGAFRY